MKEKVVQISEQAPMERKGCQISDKVDTKKELAKIANVSHDTIAKVKKIEPLNPKPYRVWLTWRKQIC